MPALREPSLGPIVGHTTDTTCRIWIRGADPDDRGAYQYSDRRTVGVIVLTEFNGNAIQNPDVFYFRLHGMNMCTMMRLTGHAKRHDSTNGSSEFPGRFT